jgi:hypothetical protein
MNGVIWADSISASFDLSPSVIPQVVSSGLTFLKIFSSMPWLSIGHGLRLFEKRRPRSQMRSVPP